MATTEWTHRGARALVRLHERELRAFLDVWRAAEAVGLELPPSDDPNYASRAALLRHVLNAARGYLTWVCEVLGRPAPDLPATPAVDDVAQRADAYVEALVTAWNGPSLRHSTEHDFDHTTAAASWGPVYCVDAMLEHAVMHPARHRFQLEELLAAR